jgi:hypothetical protein
MPMWNRRHQPRTRKRPTPRTEENLTWKSNRPRSRSCVSAPALA